VPASSAATSPTRCSTTRATTVPGRQRDGSAPDAAQLPFTCRAFDRAVASLIVHQLRDREGALRELSRVLRPDGVLLIRTVTPEAAARWIPNRFFPSVARAQEARMPPIPELIGLLRRVGFPDVGIETVVRRVRLKSDEVERAFRRDVEDRYPFLDAAELEDGISRMRAHWADRPDDSTDTRSFTFLIAAKPSRATSPVGVTRLR